MATAPGTAQPHVDDAASHLKAKQEFLRDFQGAVVTLPTTFHNRPVIRSYRRMFMAIMRNWHLATSLSRSKLKDGAAATKVQDGMLVKLKSAEAKLTARHKILQALAAAANLSEVGKTIKHGNSFSDDVVMLGPVSMKFRALLLLCDEVLDLATGLYTYGELPEEEFQTASYEVKTLLRGVDSSVRNYRIGILKRINTEVGARPGYKGAAGEQAANAEQIATEGGADAKADAPAQPDAGAATEASAEAKLAA